MLDVMFEIPSNEKVNKVVVTLDAIKGLESPKVLEGPKKDNGQAGDIKGKSHINSA